MGDGVVGSGTQGQAMGRGLWDLVSRAGLRDVGYGTRHSGHGSQE
jgi:hypothetical protein